MLSAILFVLLASGESHGQSSVPRPGLYQGQIQLSRGGRTLPLQMSLSFSEDEVNAEAEEILVAKRAMRAGFVVDAEGGPYNFSSVNYFIEDGRMDMIYVRQMDGAYGTPRFRLTGTMRNGAFQGRALTASQGDIGSFTLSRVGGPEVPLTVRPKYFGTYIGTLDIGGKKDQISIILNQGTGADINPSSFDFDFSPRKAGSLNFLDGSTTIAFSQVNVDYVRGTIEMKVVGGNGELTLSGNLSNNEIRGTANSSRFTGTFEVRIQR